MAMCRALGARGRAWRFGLRGQERWTRFPDQQLTAIPPATACSAASTPSCSQPGRAPSSRVWPGAQLGPGGQSYCKRPGRPQAWLLPAGQHCRHLPLPSLAGQRRLLRPSSIRNVTLVAEGGGPQALPSPGSSQAPSPGQPGDQGGMGLSQGCPAAMAGGVAALLAGSPVELPGP